MFKCEYQKLIDYIVGSRAWHEYFCILFQGKCNWRECKKYIENIGTTQEQMIKELERLGFLNQNLI